MSTTTLEPIEGARLLRALAAELLLADGPARNGLFLELHRLEDTLFRLALEGHPDTPEALRGQAFSIVNPIPAPHVVRELNRLGSPLATPEVRSLYKHMNVARNNMAHEAVLARVEISRSNAKRMARLATLLADQLDPDGRGIPVEGEAAALAPARGEGVDRRWYLGVGLVVGAGLSGAILAPLDPGLIMAIAVIGATLVGALLLLDR